MFLLDTNVVSETRRARPHGSVSGWLKVQNPAALFISAVTAGEIQRGIEITRVRDAMRAEQLESWLDEVMATGTILPMDDRCFRLFARLMHRGNGDHLGDAMIAATAMVHGLTVATGNVKDFRRFGIPLIDPFSAVSE